MFKKNMKQKMIVKYREDDDEAGGRAGENKKQHLVFKMDNLLNTPSTLQDLQDTKQASRDTL
jgi:hypothetical protein